MKQLSGLDASFLRHLTLTSPGDIEQLADEVADIVGRTSPICTSKKSTT